MELLAITLAVTFFLGLGLGAAIICCFLPRNVQVNRQDYTSAETKLQLKTEKDSLRSRHHYGPVYLAASKGKYHLTSDCQNISKMTEHQIGHFVCKETRSNSLMDKMIKTGHNGVVADKWVNQASLAARKNEAGSFLVLPRAQSI